MLAELQQHGSGLVPTEDVTDVAGGMLFREKDDDTLTDVSIFDAFRNFDGLNRKNRIRYDTPTYYGFSLGTSAISDQRYDGALRWGGRAMASKPSVPQLSLIPTRTTPTFSMTAPFHYCMMRPG